MDIVFLIFVAGLSFLAIAVQRIIKQTSKKPLKTLVSHKLLRKRQKLNNGLHTIFYGNTSRSKH